MGQEEKYLKSCEEKRPFPLAAKRMGVGVVVTALLYAVTWDWTLLEMSSKISHL